MKTPFIMNSITHPFTMVFDTSVGSRVGILARLRVIDPLD